MTPLETLIAKWRKHAQFLSEAGYPSGVVFRVDQCADELAALLPSLDAEREQLQKALKKLLVSAVPTRAIVADSVNGHGVKLGHNPSWVKVSDLEDLLPPRKD